MKKLTISIFAVAALLCSCTKQAVDNNRSSETSGAADMVELTFKASFSEEDTKAFLADDGHSVHFRADDEIAVFAGGTLYKFTAKETGANVEFTGSVTLESLAASAGTYYAVYPYSAASSASVSAGVISGLTIAQGNAGTGTGTFNSQKAVAVAITDNSILSFKQVTALLKVTVPSTVDDLKEIIAFNRDTGSGNTAGALAGTFNVTPVLNGEPTIEVTEPKFQMGIVGPNGSSNPFPAGDYYITVLPAQLTVRNGIDLKLTFLDSFVGRAFNGKGLKLQRGKIYNLGTLTKTDVFVYNNFEKGELTDITGNTGALSVIENPFKTTSNSSDYVLQNKVSGTGPTSGYVQIATGNDYGFIKFPKSIRSNYNKVRLKVYLGTNAYYPRMRRGSNSPARPKLNGVTIDSKDAWDAAVLKNDWNTLEFSITDIESTWSNMTSMETLEFRPLVNWDGSNVSGLDDDTNNRTIYIDDITFVLTTTL